MSTEFDWRRNFVTHSASMGRTKKEGSPVDLTRQVDPKSRVVSKSRYSTSWDVKKSYKEDSESKSNVDKYTEDKDFKDTGCDWGGESSGSEYGKSATKQRGRGKKAAASPQKCGRGLGRSRPPAKGRVPTSSRNGSKKAPTKRRRNDSDGSEESNAESSESEYRKKTSPKKCGSTSRRSHVKKRATISPPAEDSGRRSRGRGVNSKSSKEVSEDDFSEKEVNPAPKSKASEPKPKLKPPPKKTKDESGLEDDEYSSVAVVMSRSEEKSRKISKSKPAEKSKTREATKNANNTEEKKDTAKSNDERDNASKESDISSKSGGSGNGKDAVDGLKNPTETDYSAINFKCGKNSPSGGSSNFRISSWNIGGIKAFVKKNGMEYIKNESPDILCLQEIKCNEKTKPDEVQLIEGYPHLYWCYAEQNGYSGVAVFSKTKPINVKNGLPNDNNNADVGKFNKEGRLITAEYDKFYIINVYVPNSGRAEKPDDNSRPYPPKITSGERQKFDDFFRRYVKKLEEKKVVIVAGDLNVAHKEIDLKNPKTNERTAGFTKEEREGMTKLLEETTLFDSFRALYPDQKDAYTFWSYMHNARQKNIGWRLDYFLLSDKLRDSLCENVMRTEVYGSDHCPIVVFLKL